MQKEIDKINKFIEDQRISRRKLALLAGVDPTVLGRNLNGENKMSMQTLEKINNYMASINIEKMQKNYKHDVSLHDYVSLASEYSTNFDEFVVIIKNQQDTISKLVSQNDKLIDQNDRLLSELLKLK